jgi:hypothetical protein
MPNWTSLVPPAHEFAGIPLVRTPRASTLWGTILSRNLIGTYTHFVHGRTQPCDAPNCPHCAAQVPFRYHGYLCLLSEQTRKPFIFEFTAAPAELILQYHREAGTLRGTRLGACRPRKTPNGRISLDLRPGPLPLNALPEEVDCTMFMSQMWNIAATRLEHTRRHDGKPDLRVKRDLDECQVTGMPRSLDEILTEQTIQLRGGNGQT